MASDVYQSHTASDSNQCFGHDCFRTTYVVCFVVSCVNAAIVAFMWLRIARRHRREAAAKLVSVVE
jgi:hypothetical protein